MATALTRIVAPTEVEAASIRGGVRLEGVSARFGMKVAVDDLTLEVVPGEFLILLGPSGCGKTTVLRTIAGLADPSAGRVWIGDRCVDDIDPKDRDVAMVFQNYALYPHLTVAGNIAFPLRKRKVPRREREVLVIKTAAIVGLSDLLDRKPAALSGGERQRVALARAIVRQPHVFLMDEPLSNLDGPLRAAARAELSDLHSRLRTTFVYVTHDQVEAMTMGDRIAVMHEGRLQQVGQPDEVYARPANTFVARFLGTPGMNLMSGRIERGATGSVVQVPGGSLELPRTCSASGAVLAGVRPEQFVLGGSGLNGCVRAVELHGHDRVVRCDVGGRDALSVRVSHSGTIALGDVVTLGASPSDIHLFDVSTGARLMDDR